MKPLLKISNLSIYFQVRKTKFCAVNDLNLVIKENEIAGLVGESGSGKSVTGNVYYAFASRAEGILWRAIINRI